MKRLIIDTNIFARLIVGDVENQKLKAEKIWRDIENGVCTAEVSVLVIDELIWVLEKYYSITRNEYLPKLRALLGLRGVNIMEVKKELFLKIMVEFAKSKLDFTDLYLLYIKKTDQKIISFDKKLLTYHAN
mgnify:CR=1 FL=1